jgi:fructose/tagatose bisphosphate aldolase
MLNYYGRRLHESSENEYEYEFEIKIPIKISITKEYTNAEETEASININVFSEERGVDADISAEWEWEDYDDITEFISAKKIDYIASKLGTSSGFLKKHLYNACYEAGLIG